MNRFARVLEILDASVGGPAAPVGAHGAFWRGLSRNQFVAKKVYGLPMIVVGDPAASNLIKALAGELPFRADLATPPDGADYNRMPSGLPPVSPDDLAFIQQWITDGCPPDPAPPAAESVAPPAGPPRTVKSLLESFSPEAPTLEWLKESLQLAIQLELATLPPYLLARWTIKPSIDPVVKAISESIRQVRGEEMLHFGLACNLLTAVGGTPSLANVEVVPKYPGPLPGGVRPGLEVKLSRLTTEQAGVFMQIEFPEGGPIPTVNEIPVYNSIGQFYRAILSAFQTLNPQLDDNRQIAGPLDLFEITDLATVKAAIDLINLQGEGTSGSPEEQPGDLSHYYRFAEIHHGKTLVRNPNTTPEWTFTGADLPMPDTWPVSDIPKNGYLEADVTDVATWNLITTFDQQYSQMLRNLEWTWVHGESSYLDDAVGDMLAMAKTARQLVQKPKPDGLGNYGPCFRYVP